jgi:signal transduction histidine kinase
VQLHRSRPGSDAAAEDRRLIQFPSGVRIVVALSPLESDSADPIGIVRALERAADGAEIEIVHDERHCAARCAGGDADLVVVDCALGAEGLRILDLLGPTGSPVIAVDRGGRAESSVEWHRRGAAACIAVGDDYADLLPAVARTHIERHRAVRSGRSEVADLRRQFLQTEKMASIGQLAAGVAHEINNPMGFIHANLFQMSEYIGDLRSVWARVDALQKAASAGDAIDVQRASDDLAAASREVDVDFVLTDLHKAVRESQEGSERIRIIVQDLRDFSHQDDAERVLADVNQCLDSTANIVWPMMKHVVELEKDYGDIPFVVCFPMQLKQVFMNLLVNAYQAIETTVGESGELGRIVLRTRAVDDSVSVIVEDTGVGIARENLDRIFDPFFTTKKVGEGTGLGLSTCFHIVRRHGGRLTVKSEPGEGSAFELVLPVSGPDPGGDGD